MPFPKQQAAPMAAGEGTGAAPCTFEAAECGVELVEHELVRKFIQPTDAVLELGARFGTTSCAIAAQLGNSGKQVSVEPDYSVWFILAHNQHKHRCAFWTLRGVATSLQVTVSPASYATRTSMGGWQRAVGSGSGSGGEGSSSTNRSSTSSDPAAASGASLVSMSLSKIQQQVGFRFTVLLIDCEGCIDSLFLNDEGMELKESLQNVQTIILEADMKVHTPHCLKNCVDYDKWEVGLHQLGFETVHRKQDVLFGFIEHYVFQRKSSSSGGSSGSDSKPAGAINE
jgi:hypothetical protein